MIEIFVVAGAGVVLSLLLVLLRPAGRRARNAETALLSLDRAEEATAADMAARLRRERDRVDLELRLHGHSSTRFHELENGVSACGLAIAPASHEGVQVSVEIRFRDSDELPSGLGIALVRELLVLQGDCGEALIRRRFECGLPLARTARSTLVATINSGIAPETVQELGALTLRAHRRDVDVCGVLELRSRHSKPGSGRRISFALRRQKLLVFV